MQKSWAPSEKQLSSTTGPQKKKECRYAANSLQNIRKTKYLISEGKHKEFLEIAVLLLKNDSKNEEDICKSVMRIPGRIIDSFREDNFITSSFRMSADTHFTMTGIGVLLAPGDEVG